MGQFATARSHAMQAFEAAIRAVQPANLIPAAIRSDGCEIEVAGLHLPAPKGRAVLAAVGKAAPGLAEAWIQALPSWATEIFVLTPHGVSVSTSLEATAEIRRGAHPYPDETGRASARHLLDLAASLNADDLFVLLLSGGGSALMAAPEPGLTLDDVRSVTTALLEGGAPIGSVNAVRRELLAAAGGGLARAAYPARVLTLILSDVLGDPLQDIASGPTVPSSTTAADALAVLDRFAVRSRISAAVLDFLERRSDRTLDVDASPSDSATRIIGNNRTAVAAAARYLGELGYATVIHRDSLVGEAADRGRELGAACARTPSPCRAATVYGGETTVTVRGSGRGGRNQELALAAAIELDGTEYGVILAGGTDGIDGLSENAGAVVDPTTVVRMRDHGINPSAALADNDSGTALEAIGDAIRTGPTGTNVCDVTVVLTTGS